MPKIIDSIFVVVSMTLSTSAFALSSNFSTQSTDHRRSPATNRDYSDSENGSDISAEAGYDPNSGGPANNPQPNCSSLDRGSCYQSQLCATNFDDFGNYTGCRSVYSASGGTPTPECTRLDRKSCYQSQMCVTNFNSFGDYIGCASIYK